MDTNLKTPAVSVNMIVWNGEKYIREAIESVLNQSFRDFELVIINCGSTDGSAEIIKSFSDKRIVLIENGERTPLMEARNQALRASRGEYIAFLDADDIAHPERLKIEMNFLKNRPDFGMVGSHVELIDEKSRPLGVSWREKIPSEKISVRLIFGSCFAQSSVMVRRNALPEEGYGSAYAEDHDLWVRVLKNWKGALLPKVLLKYRRHGANNSTEVKAETRQATERIIREKLLELGLNPTPEELATHQKSYGFAGAPEEIKKLIDKREAWLIKLREANRKTNRYDEKVFNEVVAERFLTTLWANSRLGLYSWKKFWRSPLSQRLNKKEEWRKVLKLFIKCLIKKN